MSMDKSCLYSTVQNTSGRAATFGFLPPHGRKLDAGEEFTVFGNVIEDVGRSTSPRRSQLALAKALDEGALTIVHTPAPILKDTVSGASKMLARTGGSLTTVDPCWMASESPSLPVAGGHTPLG